MTPLWLTKAIVLVLMTILTLACCFLPILVRRVAVRALRKNGMKMFMSGCLCFGGGVLLATVFLHLLPETRASFEHAHALGYISELSYPFTELSVCLGFFFVYIVEEAVHHCLLGDGDGHQHMPLENLHSHNHNHHHHHNYSHKHAQEDHPSREKFLVSANNKENVDDDDDDDNDDDDDCGASVVSAAEVKVANFRAVMVVVALSLHSIMEGLALGLMHTNKDVWVLFAALCAHKLIIAFCMGMELLTVGVSRPAFFISLTIFSIASPLGGLAGTLVISYTTQTNAVGVLVPTCLHGLSAGTLLYVTFCEILERERGNPENAFTKLMGLLGGFLLMAVLQVIDVLYAPEDPLLAGTDEQGHHPLPITDYPFPDLDPAPSLFSTPLITD